MQCSVQVSARTHARSVHEQAMAHARTNETSARTLTRAVRACGVHEREYIRQCRKCCRATHHLAHAAPPGPTPPKPTRRSRPCRRPRPGGGARQRGTAAERAAPDGLGPARRVPGRAAGGPKRRSNGWTWVKGSNLGQTAVKRPGPPGDSRSAPHGPWDRLASVGRRRGGEEGRALGRAGSMGLLAQR